MPSTKSIKPIASLSLDIDNQWSYMKTHGDAGWDLFPSYLDIMVPRVLRFLKERELTITFFVVGQDAALEKNDEALGQLAPAGHEIGNHSFHHEPWLHLYSEPEIESEIASAEEHIERATGRRPIGFRGPGYSLSHSTLRVLARRGYKYDASTFPQFLGPLARAYYFMTAKMSTDEMDKRKILFGKFRDGFQPLKPYRWEVDGERIIEIPVTTLPVLKVPIHFSYLLYLSVYSQFVALNYFRAAMKMCRLTNTQPSLLMHPLDFIGGDDIDALSFFPAMKMHHEKKLEIMSKAIQIFTDNFDVMPMRDHAARVDARPNLAEVKSISTTSADTPHLEIQR